MLHRHASWPSEAPRCDIRPVVLLHQIRIERNIRFNFHSARPSFLGVSWCLGLLSKLVNALVNKCDLNIDFQEFLFEHLLVLVL